MRTAIAYRNLALDAELDPIETFRIYTAGSGRPANADTAITDQTLLAEITGVTWDAAAAGAKSLSGPFSDAAANATGTATWARGLTAGAVAVADFSVGEGSGEVNLNETDIVTGAPVTITSGTVTYPIGA